MTATILNWLLAAFFLIGGGVNILAPGPIRAEFQRWGFPDWFHFLVGALELAAAVMLVMPAGKPAACFLPRPRWRAPSRWFFTIGNTATLSSPAPFWS